MNRLYVLGYYLLLLLPLAAQGAISPSGSVSPSYPGNSPDPWNVGSDLSVGDSASGSIVVDAGSVVQSEGGNLGFAANHTGSVTINGAGSLWEVDGDLNIGIFGGGILDIEMGGAVTSDTGTLGLVDGVGEVAVSGTGSSWEVSENLFVGNLADGTISILSSGAIQSQAVWLGFNNQVVGNGAIDGMGSTLYAAERVSLGASFSDGLGDLHLTGMGARLYVGPQAASSGILLPAAETALIVSDTSGLASLELFSGSELENAGNAYLGFGAGTFGTALVKNADSRWSNTGQVVVGLGGTGNLSLAAGTVAAGGGFSVGNLGSIAGVGSLEGDVSNSGLVSLLGDEGDVDIQGRYSQTFSGELALELRGTEAGEFDQLSVTGDVDLAGSLSVSLDEMFELALGDRFDLLSFGGTLDGQFDLLDLPPIAADQMWQVLYDTDRVSLVLTVPGDFDADGDVDSDDLSTWEGDFGLGRGSDADGDGDSDGADLMVWLRNFGANNSAPLAVVVPEPSTALLALCCAVVFCRPRR